MGMRGLMTCLFCHNKRMRSILPCSVFRLSRGDLALMETFNLVQLEKLIIV
jgi:hypothetical protein